VARTSGAGTTTSAVALPHVELSLLPVACPEGGLTAEAALADDDPCGVKESN